MRSSHDLQIPTPKPSHLFCDRQPTLPCLCPPQQEEVMRGVHLRNQWELSHHAHRTHAIIGSRPARSMASCCDCTLKGPAQGGAFTGTR